MIFTNKRKDIEKTICTRLRKVRSPRVCILAEYYSPYIKGGAEISLESLVTLLVKNGLNVVVLTPNYGSYSDSLSIKGGLMIYRFKSWRHFLHNNNPISKQAVTKAPLFHNFMITLYSLFSSMELAMKFDQLNKKAFFDVVHSNNLESDLALLRIKSNVKKIAHMRELKLIYPDWEHEKIKAFALWSPIINYIYRIRRKQLNRIDFFIAINLFVKKQLSKYVSSDKIEVIYNPLPADLVCSEKKRLMKKGLTALFLGSLTKYKGADKIIELARVCRDMNFWSVALIFT